MGVIFNLAEDLSHSIIILYPRAKINPSEGVI